MPARTFVDHEQRPCVECGEPTFMSTGVCPICEDPPSRDGRFLCCGGLVPEHRIPCDVGDALASARWTVARRQATGASR